MLLIRIVLLIFVLYSDVGVSHASASCSSGEVVKKTLKKDGMTRNVEMSPDCIIEGRMQSDLSKKNKNNLNLLVEIPGFNRCDYKDVGVSFLASNNCHRLVLSLKTNSGKKPFADSKKAWKIIGGSVENVASYESYVRSEEGSESQAYYPEDSHDFYVQCFSEQEFCVMKGWIQNYNIFYVTWVSKGEFREWRGIHHEIEKAFL